MRLELPRTPSPERPERFPGANLAPEEVAGRARILLLTSGLGLGHVRAAQAIEAALHPRAEVFTIDLWSLMNAGVARAVHATYLSLVQNYPQLYQRLYHLDERTWRQILESESGPPRAVLEVLELISGIAAQASLELPRGGRYASDKLLFSLLCAALPYDGDSLAGNGVRARLALMKWSWLRLIRRLETAARKIAPEVIISTQMIPAAMACYLNQRGRLDAPIIAVTTDFGVHDFWRQRGIECYCIAHESIGSGPGSRSAAHGAGAARSSVQHGREIATGVPLMPDFTWPVSQQEARSSLGLPADAPIVLVLGGGLGLSVDTVATTLLRQGGGTHLLAMPGRNDAARAALARLARMHRAQLTVCDWTERMDLYLRAADIVVGKPGGITVAEALACGRPLLATRSLGGQEGFNVDFLERHGVGGLLADGELPARVARLLQDREALQRMQRRAWLLGRRDGARQIAAIALELASLHGSATMQSR